MTLPLGRRAYGSIPHLPGSRTGPADRHIDEASARAMTERARPGETVIVQEKLDGSCVCAARDDERILALGREGRPAAGSPNEGRRMWAAWVEEHRDRFAAVLAPGERLVGEWLPLVHATRYALRHEPLVAFDLLDEDGARLPLDALAARLAPAGFVLPGIVHRGGAITTDEALTRLGPTGHHGAVDGPEGLVYRVEREGRVLRLAKWVRADREPGALLPEATGRPAEWNWRPAGGCEKV